MLHLGHLFNGLCLGLFLPLTTAEDLARQVWAVAEAVQQHHHRPPVRREMLAAAARGLYSAAGVAVPADLAERLGQVKEEAQLAAIFRGLEVRVPEGKESTALEALLRTVPQAQRIPAAELAVEEQIRGNRYVGIGIQIAQKDEYAVIANPFPRGPARRAGARAGDRIVAIDGVPAKKLPLRQVVDRLRGPEGTPVAVEVQQPEAAETRILKMTRGVVPIDTLVGFRRRDEESWAYQMAPGIGYVQVRAVQSSTLHELRQVERHLQEEGCRALVLDLRVAHGDDLDAAARLTDALLDGGLLGRVRDARGQSREIHADRDCLFRGWPVAVLVGVNTRGLAPWVAAALQDNRRAAVVGLRIPCSGEVLSLVRLPDKLGGLRLPTATVERPRTKEQGRPWHVEPEHAVPLPLEQEKVILNWLISNELGRPLKPEETPPDDPQRDKAADLLKAALR